MFNGLHLRVEQGFVIMEIFRTYRSFVAISTASKPYN